MPAALGARAAGDAVGIEDGEDGGVEIAEEFVQAEHAENGEGAGDFVAVNARGEIEAGRGGTWAGAMEPGTRAALAGREVVDGPVIRRGGLLHFAGVRPRDREEGRSFGEPVGGAVVLEVINEAVGGAVVGGDGPGFFELGEDGLGELLAELDAPLIEGVDVPDDALGENLVLVEGDERAEGARGELGEEDGVGGAIAGEDFVGDELFQRRRP